MAKDYQDRIEQLIYSANEQINNLKTGRVIPKDFTGTPLSKEQINKIIMLCSLSARHIMIKFLLFPKIRLEKVLIM